MKLNNYRHGDVDIHGIEKLPKGLKEVKHSGSFVLAYGEVTGHKHVISGAGLQIFQDDKGRTYIKVPQKAEVTHEEHRKIEILPGLYEQKQEREFDYFSNSVRRVVD